MKKIALIIALCSLTGFAAPAQTRQTHPAKKDTVRDIKNQPKPRVVKGRRARMRMQKRQIKYHEKQLKKVHAAQKELKKELHKSN